MLRTLVLFLVLALAASFNITTSRNPAVTSVDIPKYLGTWYQMYADSIVYDTFEKDAYCSTAFYGDNGDGSLSVHNYAAIGAPNGSPYVIDGFAYAPDASKPGQLLVHFGSPDAFPFDAPYWILTLGPVNENGQYDYAVVSDNISLYLFVLARDPEVFRAKYQSDVLAQLTAMGFTGKTAPIETYHGKDCVYESASRKAIMKKASVSPSPSPSLPKFETVWKSL